MPSQLKSACSLVRAPRRSALATACYLALMSATGAAYAQETQTELTTPETQADQASTTEQPATAPQTAEEVDTLGTVHVTGIRRSIMSSVNTKNSSDSIVEAVSSEDLGKLPDVSIAESIARLPGLAAQRVDGRAQVIAIRGLSPDFAATLLNGREQVSTGDNRGVEFDQYPSELMSAVTVYKTPDATLIGQGLSGTINLQTVRPLSFTEQRFVANVRGEYNSLGEQNFDGSKQGYRVSASYIDQFRDNTIGVAIGVARLDSPFQEQHYKAWWWGGNEDWFPAVEGKPADTVAQQGAEAWLRSRDQVRDGVMGVLEFKPNEFVHSTLDMYYSKFEQKESTRGMMWSNDPWTGNSVYYTDTGITQVGQTPIITSGTMHNMEPIVRNDANQRDDTLYSIGWNTEFKVTDNWKATTDVYYSRAKRHQDWLETYAGSAALDSITFDYPLGSNDFPTFGAGLDYADPETITLSDPAGWGREGRLEKTNQDDQLSGIRLGLSRSFDSGPFSGIDFGFAGTRRIKDKTSSVYFAQLKNGASSVAVEDDLLGSPTDLGYIGLPGSLAYDVFGALDRYYDLELHMDANDLRKDFTVRENVETTFAKLNIDTDIGSIRLRGNVGLQYVHTNQSSTGFDIDDSTATIDSSVTRGTTYDDVLPSLNLVADFGSGWMLRLGAAKTLARPRVDDMRASGSASVAETGENAGRWSGNGGNPLLEPWRATSGDLSLEKYFGDASYVALALFYKNLDTYVYTQTVEDYDFSGFINTSPIPAISDIGTFSTPANGEGGYLRGAEISTSLEGGLLTPVLDGFGVLLNGSYTETSIHPNGPGTSSTLPGLSKIVANVTAYYEKHGFSARISQRYRSDFNAEIASLFAQRGYTRVLSDRQLDMQLGYAFQPDTALDGWSVQFMVNNITNSPYRTVQDNDFAGGYKAPLEYNLYGRQYLLGVTYSFQ
ncbi:TonB-dependent receptor [Lysobacter sp. M2-1]|uniref:TonB-dependent receptor n=1 Tax=Lysobacter sp. M2-1 TaxID=2916839 RepID=UPI001F564689